MELTEQEVQALKKL